MAEYTPTPWVELVIDGKCVAIMPVGRSRDICEFRVSPSDADAAFIVKAVLQRARFALALATAEVSPPVAAAERSTPGDV